MIWHSISEERIKPDDFLAVIEIPKGSKNKYELDKQSGYLILDRILYTSTHYPANYGFIPRTYAGDHDPLDVLVLCQEEIYPLTLVECYPIGVLRMTDSGEDDEKIIRILKIQLEHQQFDITIENDGIEAMNNVDKNRDVYDLIILDLGLPGMSGNRLCKNIRKISETPIIVLSARNSVEEKVELLQNGASDYITKPFDMNELSARIQVNIRKQKKENLTYKDIDINVANYTAKISNEQISLSKTEFELLKILVEHSEEVVTRDQIIEKLWGWDASDNLLDSTMKKLRQKIPENYIKTMRGIGYILKYEDKN